MADMPAGTTFCTVLSSVSSFGADGSDINDEPDRTPLTGRVDFLPMLPDPSYVVDTVSKGIIYGQLITVKIGADGSFKTKLVATDSPNLQPTGWKYKVTITPTTGKPLTFNMSAPGGATVNLADLLAGMASFPQPDPSHVQVGVGAPTAATPGNFYLDTSTDDVWINA